MGDSDAASPCASLVSRNVFGKVERLSGVPRHRADPCRGLPPGLLVGRLRGCERLDVPLGKLVVEHGEHGGVLVLESEGQTALLALPLRARREERARPVVEPFPDRPPARLAPERSDARSRAVPFRSAELAVAHTW